MTTDEAGGRNKDRVAGLAKGLRLLESFDTAHTRLTVTEAAKRVNLSAASARRCLLTLCEAGYARTDGKYYWLDHGVLRVSYSYAASTRLPRIIQPVLDALSERSRDSASLAVLFDQAAVIAARSTARRTMRVGLVVGSRLPLHCSATGRALLSALADTDAIALLRRIDRPAYTAHTVTELPRLRRLLARCRADGYGICDEEIEIGVRSIAVPIYNAANQVVASMSISTRADRLTVAEMVEAYLPHMLKSQAWARARLGQDDSR